MALVLNRKQGQSVDIGDDIRVIVVGIHGSRVQLAFEAPRELKIKRTELGQDHKETDK